MKANPLSLVLTRRGMMQEPLTILTPNKLEKEGLTKR